MLRDSVYVRNKLVYVRQTLQLYLILLYIMPKNINNLNKFLIIKLRA